MSEAALLRTSPEERRREKWSTETELLAQLVEEVSIVASGMERKKPRTVPRPDHLAPPKRPPVRDAHGRPVVTREQVKAGITVLQDTANRVIQ